MYEPRPGDIGLPPTVSIDLTHLVTAAVEAATSVTEHADDYPGGSPWSSASATETITLREVKAAELVNRSA